MFIQTEVCRVVLYSITISGAENACNLKWLASCHQAHKNCVNVLSHWCRVSLSPDLGVSDQGHVKQQCSMTQIPGGYYDGSTHLST